MYAKTTELSAGRVAWGNGLLLHRPVEYDREANCPNMAQTLDPDSLKVCHQLLLGISAFYENGTPHSFEPAVL